MPNEHTIGPWVSAYQQKRSGLMFHLHCRQRRLQPRTLSGAIPGRRRASWSRPLRVAGRSRLLQRSRHPDRRHPCRPPVDPTGQEGQGLCPWTPPKASLWNPLPKGGRVQGRLAPGGSGQSPALPASTRQGFRPLASLETGKTSAPARPVSHTNPANCAGKSLHGRHGDRADAGPCRGATRRTIYSGGHAWRRGCPHNQCSWACPVVPKRQQSLALYSGERSPAFPLASHQPAAILGTALGTVAWQASSRRLA